MILDALTAGTRVWLANCWSDWDREGYSATHIDATRAKRPYLHWHLAVELVTPEADDVRRGSAIQKLWNAIDARVNLLRDEFEFAALKKVHGLPRKIDTLEVLDHLGLARPLILRQLKAIRNSVEHQDRGAPGHADCLGYIDSVWYFLRSTDIFAARRILSFDRSPGFQGGTDSIRLRFVEFDFENLDWRPTVRGRLPLSAVALDQHPGSLELILEEDASAIDADTAFITGRVSGASTALWNVVQDYFTVDLLDPVPSP